MIQPAGRGWLPVGGIPDPDRPVVRSTQETGPIASELDPVDRSVVAQGRRDRGTGFDVPDPGRVIGRGSGEPSSSRVEGSPEDGPLMRKDLIEDRALVEQGSKAKPVRRRGGRLP